MILPTPTVEDTQAMHAISQHPQFFRYDAYLRRALSHVTDALVGASDPVKMHQWQGAAQALRSLSEAIGEASSVVQRMSQGGK